MLRHVTRMFVVEWILVVAKLLQIAFRVVLVPDLFELLLRLRARLRRVIGYVYSAAEPFRLLQIFLDYRRGFPACRPRAPALPSFPAAPDERLGNRIRAIPLPREPARGFV
jgi:hypothetical protein